MRKRIIYSIIMSLVLMSTACTNGNTYNESEEGASEKVSNTEASSEDESIAVTTDEEQVGYQGIIDSKDTFYAAIEAASLSWISKEDLFLDDTQYTLGQAAQLIKDNCSFNIELDEQSCKLIDCGMDQMPELLVTQVYKGDGYLTVHIVIKNVEGQYRAVYIDDCSGTSEIQINEYGYIGELDNAGEGVVSYRYGFLDKDCNYVLYYNSYYYMMAYKYPGEITNSEEWNDIQIMTYGFSDDRTAPAEFCNYFKMDENFEAIEDESLYGEDSVFRKAFEEEGIKVLDSSEVEQMLQERRTEIGLADEIMEEN